MATPGIFLMVIGHAGPHRIEMDVADQFQQIAVAINQDSLVSPLEKMAGFLLRPVVPSSIMKRKILHATRKRNITDLQCQVDMVCHKAKSVNTVAELTGSLLKEEVEA